MQMLFYVASDQLLIIKKSWPITAMLALGAISNIAFNYLLIPIMGIEGAAIATMLGYAISLVVSIITVQKENLIRLSQKCYILILEFIIFVMIWKILNENMWFGLMSIVMYGISFAYLYKGLLLSFFNKITNQKKGEM